MLEEKKEGAEEHLEAEGCIKIYISTEEVNKIYIIFIFNVVEYVFLFWSFSFHSSYINVLSHFRAAQKILLVLVLVY